MSPAKASGRQATWRRPWLYPRQEEIFFGLRDVAGEPARIVCCEASTKAGKTSAAIVWLTEQALLNGAPGRNFWWVAPVYGQAKIAFRRVKQYLPAGSFKANDQDLTLTLLSGAVVWFKSGEKPDNLYGEDVWAAVIDEASRCREDSWIAVRSTLTATRGPVRIIGNVKGRGNWFYRLSRRAQAGEQGLAFAKLTAWDAVAGGVLAAEEINEAKRLLADHVFRELYLAEPSDDGTNPFGIAKIAACTAPEGWLSDLPTVAIGVDLARTTDWTVVIGLDRHGGVTGIERWQAPWAETVRRIRGICGGTPTLVDSTGVGDAILEQLQAASPGVFTGFKFTKTSKQQLMEGLAVEIQDGRLRWPDGVLRRELDSMEYAVAITDGRVTGTRYAAPEGMHDDTVMALALAARLLREQVGVAEPGDAPVPLVANASQGWRIGAYR